MKDKCQKVDIEHLYSMIISLQESFIVALDRLDNATEEKVSGSEEIKLLDVLNDDIKGGVVGGIKIDDNGTFWMAKPAADEQEAIANMLESSSLAYKVIEPGRPLTAVFTMAPEGYVEATINDDYIIRVVNLSEYSDYLDFAPWDEANEVPVTNRSAFVLFKKDADGQLRPIMSLGFVPNQKYIPKKSSDKLVIHFKTTKSLYAGKNRRYYNPSTRNRASFKLKDFRGGFKDGRTDAAVSEVMIFYGDKKFKERSLINRIYPFLRPGTPFVIIAKSDGKRTADEILNIAYNLFGKSYWGKEDLDEFNDIVNHITIRTVTTEIDLYDLPDFVAKNMLGRELSFEKEEDSNRLYNILLYNRVFNPEKNKIENSVIYKIYELVKAARGNAKIIKALKDAGVDTIVGSTEANEVLDEVQRKIQIAKDINRPRIQFDTGPLLYIFDTIYRAISSNKEALAEWDMLRSSVGLEETTIRLNVSPMPFDAKGNRVVSNSIAAKAISFLEDITVLRETSMGVPAIAIEIGDEKQITKSDRKEKPTDSGGNKYDTSTKQQPHDKDKKGKRYFFGLGNERDDDLKIASDEGSVEFKDSVSRINYLISKAFGGNVDVVFEDGLIDVNVDGEARLAYGVAKPLMIRLATKEGKASTKVALHEMIHELKYFLPRDEYERFIKQAQKDLVKSGRADVNLPVEEVEEQLALWAEEYVDRFENDILFGRYYEIRDSLPSILKPIFDAMVSAYYYFLRLFNMVDKNVAVDTLYRLYTGEFSNLEPSVEDGSITPQENYRLSDKAVYSKLTTLHSVVLSNLREIGLPSGVKVLGESTWRSLKNSMYTSFSPGNRRLLSSYLMSRQPGYKGDKNLIGAWEILLKFMRQEDESIKNKYLDSINKKLKWVSPSYMPNMVYLSSFDGENIYEAYDVNEGDDVALFEKIYKLKEKFHALSYWISKSLFGEDAYYYDRKSNRSYNVFVTGMFLNSLAISNEEYFRDMLKMPGMLQVYRLFLQKAGSLLSDSEGDRYERIEETNEKGEKVVKLVLKSNSSIAFSIDEVNDILDALNTVLDELEDEEATSWRDIDEKKTFSLSEALRMAIEGLIKPDLKPTSLNDFYYGGTEKYFDYKYDSGYANKFVRGETLIKTIQKMTQDGKSLDEILSVVDDVLSKAKNRVNYVQGQEMEGEDVSRFLTLEYTNNPYVSFHRKGVAFLSNPGKISHAEMHYAGTNIDFYARALQDVINYAHDYIEMSRLAGKEITPEVYDKAFQYGALIVGSTRPDFYALVYAFYNQYILPSYGETPFFGSFDKDPFEAALDITIPLLYGSENDERVKSIGNALKEYKEKTKEEFNKRVFTTQKILTTLFNYVKYDSVSLSLQSSGVRSGAEVKRLSSDSTASFKVYESLRIEALSTLLDTFFIKKKDYYGYIDDEQRIKNLDQYYSPNTESIVAILGGAKGDYYLFTMVRETDERFGLNWGRDDNSPFRSDIENGLYVLSEASEKGLKLDEVEESDEFKTISQKYLFWDGGNFTNTYFTRAILNNHVFHANSLAYDSSTNQFKDGVIGTLFSYNGVYVAIKLGDKFVFLPVGRSFISIDRAINDILKTYGADDIKSYFLDDKFREELLDEVKKEYETAIIDLYNDISSFLTLTGNAEKDVLLTVKAALTVASHTMSPLTTFFNMSPYSLDALRSYMLELIPSGQDSLSSRNIMLTNSIQKLNERGAGVKRKALYTPHSIAHNIARMYAYGIAPLFFKYVPELKGITRTPLYDAGVNPIVDSNRFRGDAAVIVKVKSIVDGNDYDVTDLYPADYALLSYLGVMTFPAVGRNTYLYLNATTGYNAPKNYELRRSYFKAVVHEVFNMLLNSDLKERMIQVAGTSFNVEYLAATAYDEEVLAKIEVIKKLYDSLKGDEDIVLLRKAGLVEKLSYEIKDNKISLPAQLIKEATKTDADITLSLLRSAIKDLDAYRTMMRSEPPDGTGVVSDIYARLGYNMAGGKYYRLMTIEADIYAAMIAYIESGDVSRLSEYFPIVISLTPSTAEERAKVVRRLVGISRDALLSEDGSVILEAEQMPEMNIPKLPLMVVNLNDVSGLGDFIFKDYSPNSTTGEIPVSVATDIINNVFSLVGVSPSQDVNEILSSIRGKYPEVDQMLSWKESVLANPTARFELVKGILLALADEKLIGQEQANDILSLIEEPFGKKEISETSVVSPESLPIMYKRFMSGLTGYISVYRQDIINSSKLLDGEGFMSYEKVVELFNSYRNSNTNYRFKKEVDSVLEKFIPTQDVIDDMVRAIMDDKGEDVLWDIYRDGTGISIRENLKKSYRISELVNKAGQINVDMLNKIYSLLLSTYDAKSEPPFKFTPKFYQRFPDLNSRFFADFLLNERTQESKVKIKGAPYSIVGEEELLLEKSENIKSFKSGYTATLDLGNLQALHNELNFFHTAVAFMGNPLAYKNVETMVKRYVAVQTGRTLPVMNKYYRIPAKWRFIITKDKTIKDFFKGKEALPEGYDYMDASNNGYNQLLHLSELGIVGDPETPVDDGGGFMLPYVASPILGYDLYKPGPYKDAYSKTDVGLGGKTVFLKHAHFPLHPSFAYNGSERLFYILDRLFETDDGALKKEVSSLMESLYKKGKKKYESDSLAIAYMFDRLRDEKVQEQLADIVRVHMSKLKYLGVMPESASKNSKDYVAVDIDKLGEDKGLEYKGVPADITGYGMVTYLFQKLGNIRIKSPSQHRNVFQGSGVNAKMFDRLSDIFSMIIENNLAAVSDVLANDISYYLSDIESGNNDRLVAKLNEIKDKISLPQGEGNNKADVLLNALNDLYMMMVLDEDSRVILKNEESIPLPKFIQNIITSTIRNSIYGLDGSAALAEILKNANNIAFPTLVEAIHEGLNRMFASRSRSVRGTRLIIQGASHIAEVVEVEIARTEGKKVRYEYHVMSKQEALKQGYLTATITFGEGLPKVNYIPKPNQGTRIVIRPIRPHVFVKEDPDTGKRSFLSDEEINTIYNLYNSHYRRGEYNDYSEFLEQLNDFFKKNNIKVLHGEVIVGNVFMDNFALRPGMSISDYNSDYVRSIHVLEEAGLLSQYNLMKEVSLERFINLPYVKNRTLLNITKDGKPLKVKDLFVKTEDGRLLPRLIDLSGTDIKVALKKDESIKKGEKGVIVSMETSAGQKALTARFFLKTKEEGLDEEQLIAYAKENEALELNDEARNKLSTLPSHMSADNYFNLVSAASRYSLEVATSNLVATRIPVYNINAIRGLRIVSFEDIGNVAFVPSEYLFIAGEASDGDAYTTEMLEPKRLIIDNSLQNKKLLNMVKTLYSPVNLISTYKELSIEGAIKGFANIYDKIYGTTEVETDISDRVSLAGMTSRAVTASISQKLIGLTVKGNEGVNLLKSSLLRLKNEGKIKDYSFYRLVKELTGPSDRYSGGFRNGIGFVLYKKDKDGNLKKDDALVRAYNGDQLHLYKESASYTEYTKDNVSIGGGATINESIEIFLNIALDANKYDLSKLNLNTFTGQYINTLLMMGVDVDDVRRFIVHPMMIVLRQVLEASDSRNIETELLSPNKGENASTFDNLKRAAISMLVSSNHPLMKEIREKIASANSPNILVLPTATPGQEGTKPVTSNKSIAELLADYVIEFYSTLGNLSYGDTKYSEDGGVTYTYSYDDILRNSLIAEIKAQLGNAPTLATVEKALGAVLDDNFKKVFDLWGLVVDMKQKVSGVMAILEIFKENSPNYHKFNLQMAKVFNNILRTDVERRFLQLNIMRLLSDQYKLEDIDSKDIAKVMVLGNNHIRSELRSMLMQQYITSMISPAMNTELIQMLMRTFGIYGLSNLIDSKNLSVAVNNLLKYEYTIKVYGDENYRKLIIDYVEAEANKEANIYEKAELNALAKALTKIDEEIKNKSETSSAPEEAILAFAFTLGRKFAPMLSRIVGNRIDSWGLYLDNTGEMPVLRTSGSDGQMDSSAIMARNQEIARVILSHPLLHLAAHAHATILDDNISRRSIISFIPQVLSVMPPGLEALSFSNMVTELDSYKHLQEIPLTFSDILSFKDKRGNVKYYNKIHSGYDILNVLNMLAMDISKSANGRYTASGLVPGAVIRPYLYKDSISFDYNSNISKDMLYSNSLVSKTFLIEGKSPSITDFARIGHNSRTFLIVSQLGVPALENKTIKWDTSIKDAGPVFRRLGYTSMLAMERRPTSVINPAFAMSVDGLYMVSPFADETQTVSGEQIPLADLRKDILNYLYNEPTEEDNDQDDSKLLNKYNRFLKKKIKEKIGDSFEDEESKSLVKIRNIYKQYKSLLKKAKKILGKEQWEASGLDGLNITQNEFMTFIKDKKNVEGLISKLLFLEKALFDKALSSAESYSQVIAYKELEKDFIETIGGVSEEERTVLSDALDESDSSFNQLEFSQETFKNFNSLIEHASSYSEARQSLLDIIRERPKFLVKPAITFSGGEARFTTRVYTAQRDVRNKVLFQDKQLPASFLAVVGGSIDYNEANNVKKPYTSFSHPKIKSVIYNAVDLSNDFLSNLEDRDRYKRVDENILSAADVNNKLIAKVIEYISKKLGIRVEIINEVGEKYAGRVGDRGVIVLNMAYITSDTPLHEVAHLFYNVIKKENPELLNQIIRAIENDEIPDEVYRFMGYSSKADMILSLRNAGYSDASIEEEIVVSVLGALATMQFKRHNNSVLGSLLRLVDRAIAYFYRILSRLGIGLTAKQLTFEAVTRMIYETDYKELEIAMGFRYKKVGSNKPTASLSETLRRVRNIDGVPEPISPTLEDKIVQAMLNQGQQTIPFGAKSLSLSNDKNLNISLYQSKVNDLINSLSEGIGAVSDILGIKRTNSKIAWDEFAMMLSNATGEKVYVKEVNADMLEKVFGLDRELAEEIMSIYDRNRLVLIAKPDGQRLVYTLLEIVEGEELNTNAHIFNAISKSDNDAAGLGNAAGIHLKADERDLSMLRNIALLKAIHNRRVEIDGKVYNSTFPSDVRRYSLMKNRIERVHPTVYYRSLIRMMKVKEVRALFPDKLADFISSWKEEDVSAFERNIIEEVKMNIDLIFLPFNNKKGGSGLNYLNKRDELYQAFTDFLDMPSSADYPSIIEKTRELIKAMMREYEKKYSTPDGTVDMERLYSNVGYNLLAEALQAIDMGGKINYYNIEKDISSFDRELSTMLQSHSGVLAWFNKTHAKVMDQRIKYFTKFLSSINNYISEYKETAKSRFSMLGADKEGLYSHLFYRDEKLGINTFRLLRPGDKGWDELSKEDKAFIRRVNETIKELLYDALFERALASGLSVAEAQKEANTKLDEIYVEGMLPVFPPSLMQKMMNALAYEGSRIDEILKDFNHNQIERVRGENYFIKNLLLIQFNGTELGSEYRQRLLGISGQQIDVEQNKKLTQDIGKILTMSAFLNSKYVRYMELEMVYRAARSMLMFTQRRSGVALENLVQQLDKIAEAVVYGNRLSDGGTSFERAAGKLIHTVNQVITVAVLGLSLKTATSNFISNTMAIFRDALVRGIRSKDRFSLDEVAFALGELTNNTKKVMAVLKASRVFQSDEIDILTKRFWGNKPKLNDPANAFILDELGDKIARAITVIAQMKKDGIYDALSFDENTDTLKVEEDKLFLNKEKSDRAVLINYIKSKAATEGLVDGDNQLTSVFYSDYIVRLQAIVNETLGAFSDLDKSAISTSAVMGAITKFRTYMNSLYVRAFGPERYNPNIRHLRVVDGKVEEIPEFEVGIIRSLVKAVNYLYYYRHFSESPLTETDKENIVMAMYIVGLASLMILIGKSMDDDDEDLRTKNFLQRVYHSAVDDMLAILMFGNIKNILSNPFTTYSILQRFTSAFAALVSLDWEKASDRGLKMIGVFNTLDIMAGDYFDYSNELGKVSDALRVSIGLKPIAEERKEKRRIQSKISALRRKYREMIENGYDPDVAYDIVSQEAESKGLDFRIPFYSY